MSKKKKDKKINNKLIKQMLKASKKEKKNDKKKQHILEVIKEEMHVQNPTALQAPDPLICPNVPVEGATINYIDNSFQRVETIMDDLIGKKNPHHPNLDIRYGIASFNNKQLYVKCDVFDEEKYLAWATLKLNRDIQGTKEAPIHQYTLTCSQEFIDLMTGKEVDGNHRLFIPYPYPLHERGTKYKIKMHIE